MKSCTRFLANDRLIETESWTGLPALDFIRGELGLEGTKEGCREGDCGACAVLIGERVLRDLASAKADAQISYKAHPSCLLALGELEGRHLVTIEGLRSGAHEDGGITPVMRALLDENGSQCGFCSPGFVISLTAFLLNGPPYTIEGALAAVEGNLCRCTGYGAIRRAAARLVKDFAALPPAYLERISALEAAGVVPSSLGAFARGELLAITMSSVPPKESTVPQIVLGGGTDFYVRNPDPAPEDRPPLLLDQDASLRYARLTGCSLELGSALSWQEFFASSELRALAPGIERFEASLASPLVRARATLGGNIVNASPIADIASMLIALGAQVRLKPMDGIGSERDLPLERLYLGYKKLDLARGEIVASFIVPADRPMLFNFEKVAKRARLDIAAVNSAAAFAVEGDRITHARISAGGVAPVPILLERTSAFIKGARIDSQTAREAARLAASEASPISDVRGSAQYRLTLLSRLVIAHFDRLFPGRGIAEEALS